MFWMYFLMTMLFVLAIPAGLASLVKFLEAVDYDDRKGYITSIVLLIIAAVSLGFGIAISETVI